MARRVSGWSALGLVWGIVLGVTALGVGTLQALGPVVHPPPPVVVQAEPPVVEPEPPAVTRVAGLDTALLERIAGSPPLDVPRVGLDGRVARVVYAAPVPVVAAGRPRIALLLSGVGQSERESQVAVDALPGAVSFAVSVDAPPHAELYEAARAAGHELLASIPMEPADPLTNEGPHALQTGRTPEENRRELLYALAHIPGAVGATGASDGMRGERFADVTGALDPVLDEIGRRGLLYVDPRPGRARPRPGLVSRTVDRAVDEPGGRAQIEAALFDLERIAREKGSAIGVAGPPRPMTTERLAAWAKSLDERGFVLVPVSALTTGP